MERGSRAERRKQKERAASAVKHGLAVALPRPSKRSEPAAEPGRPTPSQVAGRAPLPLPVKLLGLGLALLGLVYGLTVFRDRRPNRPLAPPEVTLKSEGRILGPASSAPEVPSPALSGAATRSVSPTQ